MNNFIDFTKLGLSTKNSTTVKNKAKENLETFLLSALKDFYGSDRVSMVFKDSTNCKGKAISVCVGVVKDESGFEVETCVNVELTAKSLSDTTRKTSNGTRFSLMYDRLDAAEIYENEQKRKAEKAAKKKQLSEAKKQRDKEARAKRKAEAQAMTEKKKVELEEALKAQETSEGFAGEEIENIEGFEDIEGFEEE